MEPSPAQVFIAEAAKSLPPPPGGRYCCVVGCHNSQKQDGPRGVRFHIFPKDPERRHQWNKAVNRALPNKQLWEAGKNDLVCSEHFAEGKKSDNKSSPSYIPTIFPTHSVQGRKKCDIDREERRKTREQSTSGQKRPSSSSRFKNLDIKRQKVNVSESEKNEDPEEAVPQLDQEDDVADDNNERSKEEEEETQDDLVGHSAENDDSPILLDYKIQVRLPTEHIGQMQCYCDSPSSTEKSTQAIFPQKKSLQSRSPVLNFEDFSDRQIKAFFGVEAGVIKFIAFKSCLDDSKLLSKELKVCLLLCRLKLFSSFSVLSAMFGISETTAKRVYDEALAAVYDVAKDCLTWFDKTTIQARMPPSFKALYPQTRAIIDCSEIKCERPASVTQRVQLYSNYKGTYTAKFLVAIAPSGEIMFVSKCYGGRATDTDITCNSGFLDFVQVDDLILADKGFPSIEKNINEVGGLLVMPPFKCGDRQFTAKQNQDGYKCAKVRVHVERAIQRLKIFDILNNVTIKVLPQLDQILVIVAFLTNTFPDLIRVD